MASDGTIASRAFDDTTAATGSLFPLSPARDCAHCQGQGLLLRRSQLVRSQHSVSAGSLPLRRLEPKREMLRRDQRLTGARRAGAADGSKQELFFWISHGYRPGEFPESAHCGKGELN